MAEQQLAPKPLVSIITPCYNEQENLTPFYEAVTATMKPLPYDYEVVFVDDGSEDGTTGQIEQLAEQDPHVRPVELVRNFGKEVAVTAGLHQAKGDAAVILDVDMQHPPDLIPEFLDKWQRLAEVVVGVRLPTKHASLPRRAASNIFYKIMGAISETPVEPHATDYRLLDRTVIDEFNKFTERNRLTRGLVDWLGFRHAYVYFHPQNRLHGKPVYNYRKLTKLAITSFISMSLVPLKLSLYIGVFITLLALLAGVFVGVETWWLGDPLHLHVTGTAQLGILITFMVGILLTGQGLMALYVGNIYKESTNRPLYVMRRQRRR